MVDFFNKKKLEELQCLLVATEKRRFAEMHGRFDGLKIINDKDIMIQGLNDNIFAERHESNRLRSELALAKRAREVLFEEFWISTSPINIDLDSTMSDEEIAEKRLKWLKLDTFEKLVEFANNNMISLKTTKV